ncbi:MAG: ABC transporter ATP-binding protein [Anaerolineales bacterium]|nr:ABC transporter ATP-binding protein [Anaerolineales bacterium]
MEPVVRMSGIKKQFPGVLANDQVSFDLLHGEIHALLGENGAGKSTLMNILYGLYESDEGNIEVFGKQVHFSSARDAIANGLGMVHQHFMLVKPFSVAENVILGQPSPRSPMIEDLDDVCSQLVELSRQYGLAIDPTAQVWTLSVGEQQRVEILKALHRGAEILILDEPTAVLTPQEVEELVEILRRLAAEGKSIVFISHKLDEVLTVSDRITVLRDGHNVDTVATCDTDKAGLARMMVGRDVLLKVQKNPANPEDAVLEVRDLRAENDRELMALRGVNFEVRAGEILGIAGVAGNGQTELEEVIAGLRKVSSGQIFINTIETTYCTPHEIGRQGLAHIPSDRYRMGMLKDFTVAENLVLQRIGDSPFTKRGMLQWEEIRCEARQLVKTYDVRTPSTEVMAGKLSGGNAQKMVLARELARDPKVLIAAQPTRGLDVSAIEYVHKTLVEKRDAGMAILLISTELDEIFNLSDRIAVMYEGEIIGIMDRNDADLYTVGLMMAGGHSWQDEAERLQCD